MRSIVTVTPLAPKIVNPNSPRFPRGALIERFKKSGWHKPLHPLNRTALEPALKSLQPHDWRHTLGAIDVFMDNFGMLACEQFAGGDQSPYVTELSHCLHRYLRATRIVLNKRPWKGRYLLGSARSAQAGQPLPFLRFMADDAGRLDAGVLDYGAEDRPGLLPDHEDSDFNLPWDNLWPRDYREPEELSARDLGENYPRGLILPEGFPTEVEEIRLLPLKHATPELPLRCGAEAPALGTYRSRVFNQGGYGTCLSSATATALAVALHRAGKSSLVPSGGFSVSWLDYDTDEHGSGWGAGRIIESAARSLRSGLPCSERAFPYASGPTETATTWKTQARQDDSEALTSRIGAPRMLDVDLSDISRLKTLLASGWVVVFGMAWPEIWAGNSRFNAYGLPPAPLPGTKFDGGHAMVMVGYDHVDGNNQWKYQGRFYCLNSWGSGWPKSQTWGPGLCSLPFTVFLTQGLPGAFALRF